MPFCDHNATLNFEVNIVDITLIYNGGAGEILKRLIVLISDTPVFNILFNL